MRLCNRACTAGKSAPDLEAPSRETGWLWVMFPVVLLVMHELLHLGSESLTLLIVSDAMHRCPPIGLSHA